MRYYENCIEATSGVDEVYHLAADMGGIGYITASHAGITLNNALINAHMIKAAVNNTVKRFLFSSSACIYPQYLQNDPDVTPLKEDSAFPADPEEGYGLEKLFMEKLCQYVHEDWKLETQFVRFHNVYGPLGTYDGGREKLRQRFVANWPARRTETPWKYGVTASRRAPSCTSMTAWRASTGSCSRTMRRR